jgi:LCCL domain-containing protein
MTTRFIRIATYTAATALFACQAAIGQTPTAIPSTVAPTAAPTALDIGDCPDIAGGFEIGKTYACSCPPSAAGSPAGTVYGTLVYAYDSNICAAAVHAGVLKAATAGRVSVQMIDSPPVFKGTTQYGVKSEVWATASTAAFQFPPAR